MKKYVVKAADMSTEIETDHLREAKLYASNMAISRSYADGRPAKLFVIRGDTVVYEARAKMVVEEIKHA